MATRGHFSLVKYQRPVIKRKVEEERAQERSKVSAEYGTCELPYIERKEDEEESIAIDDIIPPRKFEFDDGTWHQCVSRQPATRMDAINLQQKLRSMLIHRHARETGICAVRRELYDQCYDEVIRQVAIHCPERGMLLSRIRDEWRMTLNAHEALYESSIWYGKKRAQQAKDEEIQMDETIRKLYRERDELQRFSKELTTKCQRIERNEIEVRDLEEKKQSEEVQYLKQLNQQLKDQLEAIVSTKPPKAV